MKINATLTFRTNLHPVNIIPGFAIPGKMVKTFLYDYRRGNQEDCVDISAPSTCLPFDGSCSGTSPTASSHTDPVRIGRGVGRDLEEPGRYCREDEEELPHWVAMCWSIGHVSFPFRPAFTSSLTLPSPLLSFPPDMVKVRTTSCQRSDPQLIGPDVLRTPP